MCHAPTGDTKSNNCWCFDDNDPISECNNMINNNYVGPSPSYNNEDHFFEDVNIPKYTCPCHTSISERTSNIQLIIIFSSLKGVVRKVMKSNSNSNSISPIYDDSDCIPIKTNVNNNNTSENTFDDRTLNLNNARTSADILKASKQQQQLQQK